MKLWRPLLFSFMLFFVIPITSSAQNSSIPALNTTQLQPASLFKHNVTSLTIPKKKTLINQEVREMNKGYENNPDFGDITNAPCQDCYEILGKRTAQSRTYAKVGSYGHHVFLIKANESLNYKDSTGEWVKIPRGVKKISAGIFSVFSPHHPIKANINKGFIKIGKGKNKVILNKNLSLIYEDERQVKHNLGRADWSHFTAGDEGIRIIDAWPGIDMTILLYMGRVKTNFIIKQPLPQYKNGQLFLKNTVGIKPHLHLKTINENPSARFALVNSSNQDIYHISHAIAYERNNILNSVVKLPFKKEGQNALSITVDGQYLNMPRNAYPFVIDPLFSSMDSLDANTMGTKNGGNNDPCTYTNNVPIPDDITITDLSFTFGYQLAVYAYPALFASDIHFRIRLDGSGNTPCTTDDYSCQDYKNNIPVNQCYAQNFIPIHNDLKGCYPDLRCGVTQLPVKLDFYRTVGPVATCNNLSIAWNYLPFVVKLEGKTLELNQPIKASNDSFRTCNGDPIDLTVYPEYGVPPYSYAWTPGGGTTQTITVTPSSTKVYHVTITDQCGDTVQASAKVIVQDTAHTAVKKTLCNAQYPFTWNGIDIEKPGTYVYKTKNSYGCDSIVTLTAKLIPVREDTIQIVGCGSVKYKNKTYHSSTVALDTFRDARNCDTLHRAILINVVSPKLYFPTAFTPNGDGINDTYGPIMDGPAPNQYKLEIFNRYGAVIFISYNPNTKWDGTINGQKADLGTYFYHLSGDCGDGTAIDNHGSFQLLR